MRRRLIRVDYVEWRGTIVGFSIARYRRHTVLFFVYTCSIFEPNRRTVGDVADVDRFSGSPRKRRAYTVDGMSAAADENKDEYYIVSVTLMKATGLYQLLDPDRRWPRSGVNPYRAVAVAEVAYGVASVFALGASSWCYAYDANELAGHLMLTVALFFSTIKVAWLYRNAASVRECLDATSVRFLRYNRHRPGPLRAARVRAQLVSSLFAGLWFAVTVAWSLMPLVVRDAYAELRAQDGRVRRLR